MKNSKELFLTSRSIEQQCQPKQTKSSRKIEKQKQSNKLNKKILIAKILEAFKLKAKFFPFKNTNFKNMFKTNFCFSNWSSIISARLEKKIHWPLKID